MSNEPNGILTEPAMTKLRYEVLERQGPWTVHEHKLKIEIRTLCIPYMGPVPEMCGNTLCRLCVREQSVDQFQEPHEICKMTCASYCQLAKSAASYTPTAS